MVNFMPWCNLDQLTKSANQRVQAHHAHELNAQQLEFWPSSTEYVRFHPSWAPIGHRISAP